MPSASRMPLKPSVWRPAPGRNCALSCRLSTNATMSMSWSAASTAPCAAWEVVFVDDDSPDGTAERIRALGERDPRIRCIRRIGQRGLSSACIEGMLATSAPFVAVIDGDLQHDETLLPRMHDALK